MILVIYEYSDKKVELSIMFGEKSRLPLYEEAKIDAMNQDLNPSITTLASDEEEEYLKEEERNDICLGLSLGTVQLVSILTTDE